MKKKFLLLSLFCLSLSISYAQNATATQTTTTVICTSDKTSLIQSPEMKNIWRPSFTKALIIQRDVNFESFTRLRNLLKSLQIVYQPKNTLIICNKENAKFVKEIAIGYAILFMDSFGSSKKSILEGTLAPVTDKKVDGNYDFKFTQLKTL